jgi:hypothetical protein
MPKAKSKDDPFAFVKGLFGRTESSKPSELKVEQRKADEEVLDRSASVCLSLAEHFAPLAVATQDPHAVTLALGAVREARECVRARKEVTGGGLAGGTQTDADRRLIMRVDHYGPEGQWKSDGFHDPANEPPSSNEPGIPVQAGPSKTVA